MIGCVVSGCGTMVSTDVTKCATGTAPVDGPMACGLLPLPGGGQPKLCRMVGDVTTMQSLLPVDYAPTMHSLLLHYCRNYAAAAIDPMRLQQSAGACLCSRCGCDYRLDAVCSKQALLPVSPHAETMHAFGTVLGDPMMDRLLQPDILRNVRLEFDQYRPMLAVLNGCKSAGCDSETMKKDVVQVEHAAGVVYEWLSDGGDRVLGFLHVLSLANTSYSVKFQDKVRWCSDAAAACAVVRSRHGPVTITNAQYQCPMVARRCLGDSIVGLYSRLLRCASTQIDDDSSDEFGPVSVVGGLMPPQSTFGRLHDTFACYRVESQSRGAIHVHSMVFDPSDSVQ